MTKQFFRLGVAGAPGSGKTTIIRTIRADARVLILDVEGGLNSIAGYMEINSKNLTIKKISSYEDVKMLKNLKPEQMKAYDYIVVDSLTFLYRIIARSYIKDTQKVANTNEIQHYNQMATDLFDILNCFKNLECNIIYLMHTKITSDKMQNRYVNIDFVGNLAPSYVSNDLDFLFYILEAKDNKRVFITKNKELGEPYNKIIEFTKKRDEFNIIGDVIEADINKFLTSYVNNRNIELNKLKGVNNDEQH